MRFFTRPSALALLATVTVALSPGLLAREDPKTIDITQALDMYDRANPAVLEALASMAPRSAGLVLGDLQKRGPKWVRAGGALAVDHRRLVVASFALEAAKGMRAKGGSVSVPLLEWACDQLRYTKTPLPGERWWHLGVITLLEEGAPYRALETHLWHVRRIADESRMALAHAFFEEADAEAAPGELKRMSGVDLSWIRDAAVSGGPGSSRLGSSPGLFPTNDRASNFGATGLFTTRRSEFGPTTVGDLERRNVDARDTGRSNTLWDQDQTIAMATSMAPDFAGETKPSIWKTPERQTSVARAVIRSYEALLSDPKVATEARLRLGYLRLVSGNPADALSHFSQVIATTDRRDVLYLAHLFSGWAQERAHRLPDAERAYRQAIVSAPDGKAAHLWLATVLQALGRLDEAQAASEASLKIPASTDDPWKRFGEGDLLPWQTVIASLRLSLQ